MSFISPLTSLVPADSFMEEHDEKKSNWYREYERAISFFPYNLVLEALNFVEWDNLVQQTTVTVLPRTIHKIQKTEKAVKYVRSESNSKEVHYNIFHIVIPNTYLSPVTTFIIKYCLSRMYPWFFEFKWSIYGLSYEEIYLVTEQGALYVPLKALTESCWEDIEARHTSYFKGYYANNKQKLKESLDILQSKQALKLKEHLKNSKQ